MSMKSKRAVSAALLAAAGFLPCWEAVAEAQSARVAAVMAATQREDFTRLLDSTKGLNEALKRVSLQRKVDSADAVRTSERKIQAAEAALAGGRIAEAWVLLEYAYLGSKLAIVDLMQQAPSVRQVVVQADPAAAEDHRGYVARMESTKALRDALARVADEKGDGTARAEIGVIDRLVRQADGLVAERQPRQGRAVLDHAYLRAKVQIERLRGGDTLVRALEFDMPQDEYRYEVDRNETYRLLVPVLVPAGHPSEIGMKAHLLRGSQLRSDAESMAARGEIEAAIRTMEESSREYQEAIRTAGVFLPG